MGVTFLVTIMFSKLLINMDGIKKSLRFEATSTTCCGLFFGCYEVLRKRKNNKVTCINIEQDKAGNEKECPEQIKEVIRNSSTKFEEPLTIEDLFTVYPKQHDEGNIVRPGGDLQYTASCHSPQGGLQANDELSLKNKKKTVSFSGIVKVEFTDYYDRTSDRPWRRLTIEDHIRIGETLNEYKMFEMEVHPDSMQYTWKRTRG